MKRLALLLVCLLIATNASAATYWVSGSGSNGNGCTNSASPLAGTAKLTIQGGLACLSPGDTLYIRSGTYTTTSNIIDAQLFTVPNGTNTGAGLITIAGWTGETVTIRPPDGYNGIRTSGSSYLLFQDLIVDMSNQTTDTTGPGGVAIQAASHDITFRRVTAENNTTNGFETSSSGGTTHDILLDHCVAHHNGIGVGARAQCNNLGYGIYVSGVGYNTTVQHSEFYENNGYGIHANACATVGCGALGTTLVLDGNYIHNNHVATPNGDSGVCPGGLGGSSSYGLVVSGQDGAVVKNNLVVANQGGILLYVNAKNTTIANNTITGTTGHQGGGENGLDAQYYDTGDIIRNNLIYNNTAGSYVDYGGLSTAPTCDHNLFPGAVSGCTSSQIGNPSFVSSSDFHLQSGSIAKDTGTTVASITTDYDGNSRPQNTTYDIGAYEFVTSVPSGGSAGGGPGPIKWRGKR